MSDGPLYLDGDPSEPIPRPSGPPIALGRDPFSELTLPDPLRERLIARPPPAREAAPVAEPGPRPRALRLAEVEPDEPRGAERLLAEDLRRRLAALAPLASGETGYDRFGFSPTAVAQALPLFHALYRHYFRVQSEGHAALHSEGPLILAANHGGLLPFDGAMCVVDVLLHTDPPKLLRSVVERWAGTVPWVNLFLARTGQVVGTRENVRDLLDDEQTLLVFPEGVAGVRKPYARRYQLQKFHIGFVEESLRARAPVVPVAILGPDDQAPVLFDLKRIAGWLGLPTFPVTPTFPLLGPLGLLPYPVRYRIRYGAPLHFHEDHPPEAARDPQLVRYLAEQVRREIQRMVDRERP